MTNDLLGSLVAAVRGALSLALRVVFAVAGLVLMLGLLLFGLVAGTLLVLWALLRGRRAADVRFDWQRGAGLGRAPWGRPGVNRAPPPADVVDVEAREIPDQRPRAD